MPQTGARGERILEAGGQHYTVLFTNRALAEVERALDQPIIGVLASASDQKLSIGELAKMLQIGIEHGRRDAQATGPQLTINDAWAIMDELGFAQVTPVVFGAIADVLSYGAPKSEGERPSP